MTPRSPSPNILEGNRHRPDYRGVPSVAFTVPPIAAVGLSESAARKQARKLRVNSANVPELVYGPSRRRSPLWIQNAGRRG